MADISRATELGRVTIFDTGGFQGFSKRIFRESRLSADWQFTHIQQYLDAAALEQIQEHRWLQRLVADREQVSWRGGRAHVRKGVAVTLPTKSTRAKNLPESTWLMRSACKAVAFAMPAQVRSLGTEDRKR